MAILSAALGAIHIRKKSGRHPKPTLGAAFHADAKTHKGIFQEELVKEPADPVKIKVAKVSGHLMTIREKEIVAPQAVFGTGAD